MPKSKKRKARFTPKPRNQQQSLAATAQQTAGTKTTVARSAQVPVAKANPTHAPKLPVMPQVNITTELKVIGILTFSLFVLVVVLYFILR